MEFFAKGLKNEFETARVNEPSGFEPLKFYCTLLQLVGGPRDSHSNFSNSDSGMWYNWNVSGMGNKIQVRVQLGWSALAHLR